MTWEAKSVDEMKRRRKAVSDPTRLRLCRLLSEDREWTAKELASALGQSANGLYYHLRLLEDAGMATVVGKRAEGRMTERVYRGELDKQITIDLRDPLGTALYFNSMLDVAKLDVEDALVEHARGLEAGAAAERNHAMVESPEFTTTPEEIVEFQRQLSELLREFRRRAQEARDGAEPADLRRMKFTYALCDRPAV